jgi:hypothetical protein
MGEITREQMATYFCKRLGIKEGSLQWTKAYDEFLNEWSEERLRDQYAYVLRIHTGTDPGGPKGQQR